MGLKFFPRRPAFRAALAGMALLFGAWQAFGQDLSISTEDLRIEQRVDGGFHLFIRKKPGIGSVLLTESTRDASYSEPNYAYQVPDWNAINGDEIRLLDGRPIPPGTVRSIIDSSPEPDAQFGEAFRLYIPYILNYGYETTRHGEVYVVDGTYMNIRSFVLPYGDYRGSFQDNPFTVRVTQQPLPGPPVGNYMKDTEDAFTQIVSTGQGELVYSLGPEDLVDKVGEILLKERGNSVDLVVCLDTTGSMRDDIDSIRARLIPLLENIRASFLGFRIGMVLYKDYYETYLTKVVPFTDDFGKFQADLNAIQVGGGRDIPEAVYEALYEGATKFPWDAESNLIMLIGDAPPHPRQRGTVSKEMVDQAAAEKGIRIDAIILPQ